MLRYQSNGSTCLSKTRSTCESPDGTFLSDRCRLGDDSGLSSLRVLLTSYSQSRPWVFFPARRPPPRVLLSSPSFRGLLPRFLHDRPSSRPFPTHINGGTLNDQDDDSDGLFRGVTGLRRRCAFRAIPGQRWQRGIPGGFGVCGHPGPHLSLPSSHSLS